MLTWRALLAALASSITCVTSAGMKPNSPTYVPNRCFLDKAQGPCRDYARSYFFNVTAGHCEAFVYGGCGGNWNRFNTLNTCHRTCTCAVPPETGPCRGHIRRWFYSPADGCCRPFIYGGCGGNSNSYATWTQCSDMCGYPTAKSNWWKWGAQWGNWTGSQAKNASYNRNDFMRDWMLWALLAGGEFEMEDIATLIGQAHVLGLGQSAGRRGASSVGGFGFGSQMSERESANGLYGNMGGNMQSSGMANWGPTYKTAQPGSFTPLGHIGSIANLFNGEAAEWAGAGEGWDQFGAGGFHGGALNWNGGAQGSFGAGMGGEMETGMTGALGTGMAGAMGTGMAGAMGTGIPGALGAVLSGAMGAGMGGAMGAGMGGAMGAGMGGAMEAGMGGAMGAGMDGAMGTGMGGAMGAGMGGAMGAGIGGAMGAGMSGKGQWESHRQGMIHPGSMDSSVWSRDSLMKGGGIWNNAGKGSSGIIDMGSGALGYMGPSGSWNRGKSGSMFNEQGVGSTAIEILHLISQIGRGALGQADLRNLGLRYGAISPAGNVDVNLLATRMVSALQGPRGAMNMARLRGVAQRLGALDNNGNINIPLIIKGMTEKLSASGLGAGLGGGGIPSLDEFNWLGSGKRPIGPGADGLGTGLRPGTGGTSRVKGRGTGLGSGPLIGDSQGILGRFGVAGFGNGSGSGRSGAMGSQGVGRSDGSASGAAGARSVGSVSISAGGRGTPMGSYGKK